MKVLRVLLQKVGASSRFTWRTHNCGELTKSQVGESVTVCGWLQYNRMKQFLLLRDSYGIVQIMVPDDAMINSNKLPRQSILQIDGVVHDRPEGQQNQLLPTGDIEIVAKKVAILNRALLQCPIELKDDLENNNIRGETDESLRLKYRYIDLRSRKMQNNLRLRSRMTYDMRKYLIENEDFVDVETPTLFRATPGGAAEFVVPSSNFKGELYSLPQSPQQFKQLLMVGGIDRYFQIARCYRDEPTKSDRQPEFTQLDIELSFTTQNDVMSLTEQVINASWPESLGDQRPSFPFKRIKYIEAMQRFGVDKPDLRFGMEIKDLSTTFKSHKGFSGAFEPLDDDVSSMSMGAIFLDTRIENVSKNNLKKLNIELQKRSWSCKNALVSISDLENETGLAKSLPSSLNSEIMKMFQSENCQCGLISWGASYENVLQTLGFLRVAIVDMVEAVSEIKIRSDKFEFLWVTDFPLFERDNETGKFKSAHHPFTAPVSEDIDRLWKRDDIGSIKAQHYDLVLNGNEIGGGSIRIHEAALQRWVLENVLNEDALPLKHLLDALECGAPPHGGIAIGLDRYFATLCNSQSIREVIAFPKTRGGRCLMSGAPIKSTI